MKVDDVQLFFITPGANKTRGVNYLLYLIDWVESQLFYGISEKKVSMYQSNDVQVFLLLQVWTRIVVSIIYFILYDCAIDK